MVKMPKWWSYGGRELAPPWTIARRVMAWPLMMAARLLFCAAIGLGWGWDAACDAWEAM
jgi:hypothetical protein